MPLLRGSSRRLRALVADDDADIAKIVAVNLRSEGFDVDIVADGWSAHARAVRTAPDLVVLDVGMPGCSGLDVLGMLRTKPQTRHIPVVLLTARASDADVWAGWKAGAAYYLTKPFDPEQLLRFVHGLVDDRPTGT